jgi:anthranilate phosphoribosyltransferase
VRITRSILDGEQGPRRSVTLLNAGAGIYAAEAASSIEEAIQIAADAIDSGRAQAKMEELVAFTQRAVAKREGIPA